MEFDTLLKRRESGDGIRKKFLHWSVKFSTDRLVEISDNCWVETVDEIHLTAINRVELFHEPTHNHISKDIVFEIPTICPQEDKVVIGVPNATLNPV